MTRIAILALTLALAATGCATVEADADRAQASDIEGTLRGAGFVLIPSDTPARIRANAAVQEAYLGTVPEGGGHA